MSTTKDKMNQWGKADPIVGRFFNNLAGGETTAEKQARELREKAEAQAQNEFELAKETRISNNATAQDAANQVNGQGSDAEIMRILQMMQNGYSPAEIEKSTGADSRTGGGAQAYTPYGGQQAPQMTSAVSAPTALPAGKQTATGGAFGAGQTIARAGGFGTRTKTQPYQDSSGSWVYPSGGQGRNIDGGAYQGGVDTLGSSGEPAYDPQNDPANYDSMGGFTGQGTAAHQAAAASGGAAGRVAADGGSVSQHTPSLSDFSPEDIAAATGIANKGRWSQQGEYDKANATERDMLDELRARLGGIKNPELGDKYSDMTNHAVLGQDAKNAQTFGMDKLKGLTDIKETAEERLMREVARRNQENQMVSQRKATQGNLAARGVYGSGAELASMLGAQSTTAQSRALEEMSAQANAQKRAMDALGHYTDAGFKLGDQDLAFGTQANKTDSFNKQMKQQDNQWRVGKQQDLNNDEAKRAATTADATRDYAHGIKTDANNRVATIGDLARLKTGIATGGTQLQNGAASHLADTYAEKANRTEAADAAKGSAFNLMNF